MRAIELPLDDLLDAAIELKKAAKPLAKEIPAVGLVMLTHAAALLATQCKYSQAQYREACELAWETMAPARDPDKKH